MAGSVTSSVMVVSAGPGGVGGGLLGLGAQGLHGPGRVVGRVDRRAGHEHVGAGVRAPLDGFLADPAVDLKPDRAAVPGDQGPGPAQLGHDQVQEPLAAEARLHRHQQQHVDLAQQVLVRLDRGPGVDRQPGPGAGPPDLAQGPARRLHRLGVDGDVARARLGVAGGPLVGIFDHQVTVDRQADVFEQRLNDGQAEGQVRDEVIVHDVHVQPVGGRGDGRGLVGEPGEVRGQDAGRDLNGHSCHCAGARPRDGRGEPTLSVALGTVWGVEGPDPNLLERVRKLLAKAEDDSVTPAEAEALTAKAAELMARYGIDRALLAAARPETDRPADRVIDVPNPWADVRAHLLAGLVSALRCQCVLLPVATGKRVHVFGYSSDLERTEVLYTSLLIQMAHGLAATRAPPTARSPRAWRRSWLLGYSSAVTSRVLAAEQRAASEAA